MLDEKEILERLLEKKTKEFDAEDKKLKAAVAQAAIDKTPMRDNHWAKHVQLKKTCDMLKSLISQL